MSILDLAKVGKDNNKMKIGNPCIFPKGSMWYLAYREIFENGTYVKKQTTCKVKVNEKPLIYMTSKWLPAFWVKLESKYSNQIIIDKSFGNFYKEYLGLKSNNISYDKTVSRSSVALEYFGKETDVRQVKRLDIKKYIHMLELKGLHGDTLKSYFYMLSGILELAVDAEVITSNPCKDLRLKFDLTPDKDATRPFDPKEVSKLLSNADGELKNYLGIAFNTGMSPEEIIALMPQDIDLDKKTIKIQRVITKGQLRQGKRTKKTMKSVYRYREIPLFDSVLPYLLDQMQYAQQRHSLFIFCREDGARYNDIQDVRGQKKNNTKWYKLIRECGIADRPLKNCRHTWAVQAIKSKQFTLQEIADTLGHANLRMLINHYADHIEGSARNINPSLDVYSNDNLSYSLSYSDKTR